MNPYKGITFKGADSWIPNNLIFIVTGITPVGSLSLERIEDKQIFNISHSSLSKCKIVGINDDVDLTAFIQQMLINKQKNSPD